MTDNWLSHRSKEIRPSEIRKVTSRVEEAKRRGIEITNLSIGRPDFDTPAHIKDAAKKGLDDGLVHYTASAGISELRQAVCRCYREDHQLNFDPDQVVVTIGATEAIFATLQGVLNPGDEVIVPQPTYPNYIGWSVLGGAQVVTVPLREENSFSLKAEDVDQHVTSHTKALILNSPHNPTGQVFDRDDMLELAELAIRHDFLVVSDDVYQWHLYDQVEYFNIAQAEGMQERTVIVGSFSKSYAMDGWRVGYLIAPRRILSSVSKMHHLMISCPNTFVQMGALAALTEPQDCVHEMVNEYDRRRRLLMSYLDALELHYMRPRGAFYIFPSIKKTGLTSGEFSDFLFEDARVAVVPGDAFGAAGEGYVRISYSVPYEELEKAMERVRGSLSKLIT
jgi:aminotransferase